MLTYTPLDPILRHPRYIQKYNTIGPVASTHLSIHGPIVGVAALPGCGKGDPMGSLCQTISATLSKVRTVTYINRVCACVSPHVTPPLPFPQAAYTERVQDGLFQAGYFRDAAAVDTDAYKTVSEIGAWNGEADDPGGSTMAMAKTNFLLTDTFAMVQVQNKSNQNDKP